MFAKHLAIACLITVFAADFSHGQPPNKSPSKPDLGPAAEPKSKPARAAASDNSSKGTIENILHGDVACVAITNIDGDKRIFAEDSVDERGRKAVSMYIDENGHEIRRSKEDPFKWDIFDENVKTPGKFFYGNVELLGDRDVRITDAINNQFRLLRPDGTWEWQLGSWDVTPSGDGVYRCRTDYTIRFKERGTELIDHREGHTYDMDAFNEQNKLAIQARSGELSYINRLGEEVTIRTRDNPNTPSSEIGERIVRSERGAGPGIETDAGGRQVKQFDRNRRSTHEYRFEYPNGHVRLNQFKNEKGIWELDDNPDPPIGEGRQKWVLSGTDGHGASFEADFVTITRDNDVVIRDGETTIVNRTDGSVVTVVTKHFSDGTTETVTTVGTQDVKNAYSLTHVTGADGKPVRKEFVSSAGHFKTTDGQIWDQYDEEGKAVHGKSSFIDVEIEHTPQVRAGIRVESGTLIKHSYQPQATTFVYTNGVTIQKFRNGSEVRRYDNGDILYVIDAATGRKRWFNYSIDKDGKRTINGLEEFDMKTGGKLSEWKWKSIAGPDGKDLGYFVNPDGKKSFAAIRVEASGEIAFILENKFGETRTTTYGLDRGETKTETVPFLARALKGDAIAQFLLGQHYFNKGEMEKAKSWYEKAAEQGNPGAKQKLETVKRILIQQKR